MACSRVEAKKWREFQDGHIASAHHRGRVKTKQKNKIVLLPKVLQQDLHLNREMIPKAIRCFNEKTRKNIRG